MRHTMAAARPGCSFCGELEQLDMGVSDARADDVTEDMMGWLGKYRERCVSWRRSELARGARGPPPHTSL
jgi:hypothetical protein